MITWFNDIANKDRHTFVQFDIVDFYPSISKYLFLKSINYAKTFTDISNDDTDILLHCKKSFLFGQNSTWVKKEEGTEEFDITMGSFDGAESCELVGLYILHMLSNIFDKEKLGLYRDDGLAVLRNVTARQADKIRKEVINKFKEMGLNITIRVNMKIVDFLDVTFNLKDGTYRPYHKPDDLPMYINTNSNHPPNIIKQIPETINKRLNELSSNIDIFQDSAPFYNRSLKDSGYTQVLSFNAENPIGRPRNRSRNILWFNPPYSVNVKSNIAHTFLKLVDKHFPRDHQYNKIFNRNNVKVSYSCLPNVESHIKSHNAKVLKNDEIVESIRTCNCPTKKKDLCPLQGNCLIDNVVYRGLIEHPNKIETNYLGLTKNHFKGREREHEHSFREPKKEKSSELAKYMWNEKRDDDERSKITWSIIERVPAYRNGDAHCRLCLAEKYHIIFQPFDKINKRNEIVSKCRHENMFYLSNYKP